MAKYQVVFGNRRYEACKKLGMKTIKAIDESGNLMEVSLKDVERKKNSRTFSGDVASLMASIKENGQLQPIGISKSISNRDFLLLNAIENVQREDISPIELGKIVKELKEEGMSQREIGVRFGVSKGKVDSAIAILEKLPPKFHSKVGFLKTGKSREGVGRMSASTVMAVLSSRLNKVDSDKVFEIIVKDDIEKNRASHLSRLVKQGMTPSQAAKAVQGSTFINLSFLVDGKILKEMRDEHKVGTGDLMVGLLKGDIPINPKLVFAKIMR